MFWFILRTTLYLTLFAIIWYGGKFYVSQELYKGMHETSPYAIFVDQKILDNETKAKQQNGSITYPFSNIETALLTAAEKNIPTIIIASGNYKEELVLPDNVTLYGSGDNVIISQETAPFVYPLTTSDNTKLINLTISGGNHTVIIPHNTSTTLLNTTVSDANDFGIRMGKKNRPTTSPDKKSTITYEVFNKTDAEIAEMPLVRFSNVLITKNDNQGMYLRDGRVEIVNSKVIENGEEGIDLHPHMHVIISNTDASNNGESGLETEIYDNIVTITNSTFNNNTKSGIALITSMGIGDITLAKNTILDNQRFGLRCAIHKNKPKKPRPFFQSMITEENNLIENNIKDDISETCFTF